MPDKKLILIGDGPELPRIKPFLGANVTWLGYQPTDVLRDHLRRCKAFIFAAKEDFGILPLEAQACGAPVIAFGEGGAMETVRGQGGAGQTGLFHEMAEADLHIASRHASGAVAAGHRENPGCDVRL